VIVHLMGGAYGLSRTPDARSGSHTDRRGKADYVINPFRLTYRSPRSREVRSACGPASRGSGFGSGARAGAGGAERSCGRLTGGGGGAERSCGRLTGDGAGASRIGAEGGAAAGGR
jgi:hypothetical protein